MVRTCTACKETKEENQFTRVKTRKGTPTLQSWCKACKRLKTKKYMADKLKDPEYRIAVNIRRKNRGTKAKEYWVKYFGGKCIDCSGVFHYSVYDFHHILGDKEVSPSHILRGKSITDKKVLEELNKCVLLCANCHRMRHHKRLV